MTLRVRTKLILLIVIPLLAALGIAALGMSTLSTVTQTATRLTEERLIPVWRLDRIARQYTQHVVDLAHKTRAQMLFWHEAQAQLAQAKQVIAAEWDVYLGGEMSDQEREILAKYPAARQRAEQSIGKLQGFIAEQSSYGMGNYVDLELYQEVEPVLSLIDELVQAQGQLASEAGQEAERVSQFGVRRLMAAVAMMTVFVVALGWWLNAGITQRMNRLLVAITDIELHKDLSIRSNLPPGDEFGDMGRRFDRMMDEIGQLMAGLQLVGHDISGAGEQLLNVIEQNKQQSHEQSGEIAEMVTGMRQVNESADVVLDNVNAADAVSHDAQELAQTGNQTVQDTVAAINHVASIVQEAAEGMDSLKSDSENIGTVLEVIKSIAEQTNLLALNAAIEAARAGEQGRGFSVVADEVRQLASRTSDSTQEIQDIIRNIQQGTQRASQQMRDGADATESAVAQAQAAGRSLQTIVEGFATIRQRSGDIQAASQQQRDVVTRVGDGAGRIDQLAQRGAELSDDALGTSRHVATLSQELGVKLGAFKV